MSTLRSGLAGLDFHARASGNLMIVCAGSIGLAAAPDGPNGSAASSEVSSRSRRLAGYSMGAPPWPAIRSTKLFEIPASSTRRAAASQFENCPD
jgi:hypothetical protein